MINPIVPQTAISEPDKYSARHSAICTSVVVKVATDGSRLWSLTTDHGPFSINEKYDQDVAASLPDVLQVMKHSGTLAVHFEIIWGFTPKVGQMKNDGRHVIDIPTPVTFPEDTTMPKAKLADEIIPTSQLDAPLFNPPAAPTKPEPSAANNWGVPLPSKSMKLIDQNGDETEKSKLLVASNGVSFYAPKGWNAFAVSTFRQQTTKLMEDALVLDPVEFLCTFFMSIDFHSQPLAAVAGLFKTACDAEAVKAQQEREQAIETFASGIVVTGSSITEAAPVTLPALPTPAVVPPVPEPVMTPPPIASAAVEMPKPMTPDEVMRALWVEFLTELKVLRPDITDKSEAMKTVKRVLGYPNGNLTTLIEELGTDGLRALWAENKNSLTNGQLPAATSGATDPSNQSDLTIPPVIRPAATTASNKPKSNGFKWAIRLKQKARIGITGPGKSGKTTLALQLATALAGETGRIAVIDADGKAANVYARLFTFDSNPLDVDHRTPEDYIAAIQDAESSGYAVLVIDGITPEWEAILAIVDGAKDKYPTGWGLATPKHNEFVKALMNSKMHIVVTMQCKTLIKSEKLSSGKTVLNTLGTRYKQRPEFDYNLQALFMLSKDHAKNHKTLIVGSRCDELNAASAPDGVIASQLACELLVTWLNDGVDDTDTSATTAPSMAAYLKEVAATTALDMGDGIMLPLSQAIKTAITEETYERGKRQQGYITEKRERVAYVNCAVGQIVAQITDQLAALDPAEMVFVSVYKIVPEERIVA